MAEAQLPTTRYLEHAFKDQHNLVVLFGGICFSLAFASPMPLLVSAGGELFWLLLGPRLPTFRHWVDEQLSTQSLARAETAIEGALAELSELEVNRYRAVSHSATQLIANAQGRLPARQLRLGLHRLLELRRTFLDYVFLTQRVEALLETTPAAELEQQAAQLQETYRTERELTARMTIRKSLSSLQRRISQQTALRGVTRNIELRLEMLEQSLLDLQNRVADPAFESIATEVDSALTAIGPAETLELAVDEIFEHHTTEIR
ncbi:MAG TPA: hypothetical protein VJV79_05955 [Polyangiaceae bacterium]|nr:hypothetical protein [Polyangiaceae bacterium]